jgi:hypothetical protein
MLSIRIVDHRFAIGAASMASDMPADDLKFFGPGNNWPLAKISVGENLGFKVHPGVQNFPVT